MGRATSHQPLSTNHQPPATIHFPPATSHNTSANHPWLYFKKLPEKKTRPGNKGGSD